MFSFFKRLAKKYDFYYAKWPFSMAFMTMFVKGSMADYLTQTQIETRIENPNLKQKTKNSKNSFDSGRNMRFSLFCGVYTGWVQHFIYNMFYPRLFPKPTVAHAMYRVMLDHSIHAPFVYLPTYYGFKSVLVGGTVKQGFSEYFGNMKHILLPYYKFWGPFMFVVFYWIPPNFRIASIGAAALIWCCILSFLSPMIKD